MLVLRATAGLDEVPQYGLAVRKSQRRERVKPDEGSAYLSRRVPLSSVPRMPSSRRRTGGLLCCGAVVAVCANCQSVLEMDVRPRTNGLTVVLPVIHWRKPPNGESGEPVISLLSSKRAGSDDDLPDKMLVNHYRAEDNCTLRKQKSEGREEEALTQGWRGGRRHCRSCLLAVLCRQRRGVPAGAVVGVGVPAHGTGFLAVVLGGERGKGSQQ